MPYPSYLFSFLEIFIDTILPLFTVLSFAFIVPPLLKRIVQDKQSGVKELMKMMGLPNWMNWLNYFMDALISCAASILIITILICVVWDSDKGSVLNYSNPVVIFIFFLLYAMSLVVFLFALSALFNSRKSGLKIALFT